MWDLVRDRLERATLGQYIIEAEIGRGGMAAVFLAHEIALDRRVAIKVMSPALLTGEGMVERFRHEAMTVAKLNHPHIVTIYAVRQADDLEYFVMTYVEGRSFDRIIPHVGALSVQAVRAVISQVASALHYAHRRGVIHRDIKPANIMLDDDGNCIVTDFGIARAASGPRLTMTGGALGTPAYMSPEQCNALDLTGASDQYSLGIVAYEMLAGEPPYSGSALEIMVAHTHEVPRAIDDIRPDCPPDLAAIVRQMLEKDPAKRFANMAAVGAAIGMPPLGDDDPVRRELVGLALTGEHERPRINVPVSPPLHSVGVRPDTPSTAQPLGEATSDPDAPALSLEPPLPGIPLGNSYVFDAPAEGTGAESLLPGSAISSSSPAESPGAANYQSFGPSRPGDARPTPPEALPAQRARRPMWATALRTTLALGAVIALVALVWNLIDEPAPVTPPIAVIPPAPPPEPPPPPDTSPTATPREVGVRITPELVTVVVGNTARLTAAVRGEPGPDARLQWSSSDSLIATVSPNGAVTGVAPGTVGVVATIAGRSDTTPVTVRPIPVARLSLEPGSATVVTGNQVQLRAAALDARGQSLPYRDIGWRSSNPSVATVDTITGAVTGVQPGSATIIASSEGVQASATIAVESPRAPDAVPPPRSVGLRAIGAGGAMTCAIAEAGATACWGGGRSTPTMLPGGDAFQLVAIGDSHSCALRGGLAHCWGANGSGQLGDSSTRAHAAPAPVAGNLRFKDISVGGAHSCGVTQAGGVFCWGSNNSGQLGDGSTRSKSSPVAVTGASGFTAVSAGREHTCGVTSTGKVYCWGYGFAGALGHGFKQNETQPVEVIASVGFSKVRAGAHHTCALATSGRLYCWGENTTSQLGDGSVRERLQPTPVQGSTTFLDVAVGAGHSCGLRGDGSVACWGDNRQGQLGTGNRARQAAPAAAAGEHKYSALAAGANHTCALTTTAQLFCWGDNARGQLGIGSTVGQQPAPMPVTVPPE